MKIAIRSDVHGNLEALRTTLEDIKKRDVDKIFCLGDTIMKGVHNSECIRLIKENCDIILRGNTDRHFTTDFEDISIYPEYEQKRIKWMQEKLSNEEKTFLHQLPFSYEFYMSGSLVRIFHATPEYDDVPVLNHSSIKEKLNMFYPSKNTISQEIADVVIYGHIHHPYMDSLYNKTLINVGSIGNPFETIRNPEKDSNCLEITRATYLILEGEYGSKEYKSDISFQLIKVPYDIDKELVDENLNIEKENYHYELKNGMYRNMEKVNENFRKAGISPDEF